MRKDTRLSTLFRTANNEKLGGAWERGYLNLWGSGNFFVLTWHGMTCMQGGRVQGRATPEIFSALKPLRLILRPYLGQNTRNLIYGGKRGYNFLHLNKWSDLWLCFELFSLLITCFCTTKRSQGLSCGALLNFYYQLREFSTCILWDSRKPWGLICP